MPGQRTSTRWHPHNITKNIYCSHQTLWLEKRSISVSKTSSPGRHTLHRGPWGSVKSRELRPSFSVSGCEKSRVSTGGFCVDPSPASHPVHFFCQVSPVLRKSPVVGFATLVTKKKRCEDRQGCDDSHRQNGRAPEELRASEDTFPHSPVTALRLPVAVKIPQERGYPLDARGARGVYRSEGW